MTRLKKKAMTRSVSWLAVLLLLSGWAAASAQSLAEIAEKEKKRREQLRAGKGESCELDDLIIGTRSSPSANAQNKTQNDTAQTTGITDVATELDGDDNNGPAPLIPHVTQSPAPSVEPDSKSQLVPLHPIEDSDPAPSDPPLRGLVLAARAETPTTTPTSKPQQITPELEPTNDFIPKDLYIRGRLYIDWLRTAYLDTESFGQLSNRVKLELGRRPGDGWRVAVDVRDRVATSGERENQFIVYDAYLTYDENASRYSFSVGQMNLFDTAGIGTLLGGQVGYELGPSLTVGGYGGLESNIYDLNLSPSYQKFGAFARYDGVDARSITLSYNTIRFAGNTERQFLYTSGLIPLDSVVLYGNLEFELGSHIAQSDRLSRAFLNARIDVTENMDITANYSSGKGLDYHRFLLEQSQNPSLTTSELERFYYSTQFGARFSYRFHPQVRAFIEQRRSEQKDRMIVNHTTRLGASAFDFAGTGFSFYGSYSINRGDASESNAFRVSASRDFGPISWSTYFSSSFNGIRFDPSSSQPVIIHIDNRRTLSNDLFYVLSRAIALSFEHEFSKQGEASENTVFVRAMYRF